MVSRILIMGLPGAGKTTLAASIRKYLELYDKKCIWLNADKIRQEYNDWDFTLEGRLRQSKRMYSLSTLLECDFCIADFVAPLPEMRDNFSADHVVWVDTITEGRFADTNKMFEEPTKFNFRVTTQDAEYWGRFIAECILTGKNGN